MHLGQKKSFYQWADYPAQMVKNMTKNYMRKLPSWYSDNTKYDIVLSDDLDGLISTSALKYTKGWDVKYFYDFETLYIDETIKSKRRKSVTRVWSDVSIILSNEKTFDNHVNRVNTNDYINKNSINPNLLNNSNVVEGNSQNYFNKYVGSTALVIWSIYNIPLPKTEEGKMLLMAIDTAYKGFYSTYPKPRMANKFYLCDMLGFPELYQVQQLHTEKEFRKIGYTHNTHGKIEMNENRPLLEHRFDLNAISELLEIPIKIPELNFTPFAKFKRISKETPLWEYGSIREISPKLATIAFTGQGKGCYSIFDKMCA